jgi:Fe-coproporphyrin III synthase
MSKYLSKILLPILKNIVAPTNKPYFCTYSVTWRCNAKCKMCAIWRKTNAREMGTCEIQSVFKQIQTITGVKITGGEPFLRDDLPEILDLIRENTSAQFAIITTNGILTDRIVNLFKNNRKLNIRLKISLTGFQERHDQNVGFKGAYVRVMETIEALKYLMSPKRDHLSINHTITDVLSYEDSREIRAMCQRYRLSYLPEIARLRIPLYSENDETPLDHPGVLSINRRDLKPILSDLISATKGINNPIEKYFKLYYLKILYIKFVENRNMTPPKCVVLRNHVRLLPNGDVPVCLYNPSKLGNLLENSFEDLWQSKQASLLRNWVDNCNGCWQDCDLFTNLVYSGDVRNILRSVVSAI